MDDIKELRELIFDAREGGGGVDHAELEFMTRCEQKTSKRGSASQIKEPQSEEYIFLV